MPNGRPTKYTPAYTTQAAKLCLLGATDVEIADFFGIGLRTLNAWKQKYPELTAALKTAKDAADDRVERSLYHKALGYSFDAVKIFMPANARKPVYAPYREHIPPDTTACIFWLKNRRKEQWRDVHKIEHGQPGDFDKLGDEELVAEMRKEAATLGISGPVKANGKANGKTQH